MEIKLTRDTIVRFPAGTEIIVSEEEGKRLIALGNAEEQKPKASKKRAAK